MKRSIVLLLTGAAALVAALPAHHAGPAPVATNSCFGETGISVLGVDPGSYVLCVGPGDPT